jgi:hypothetical protein
MCLVRCLVHGKGVCMYDYQAISCHIISYHTIPPSTDRSACVAVVPHLYAHHYCGIANRDDPHYQTFNTAAWGVVIGLSSGLEATIGFFILISNLGKPLSATSHFLSI